MASPNASSSPISIGWSSTSSGSRSSSFSSTSSTSSTWDAFSFVSTSNNSSLTCAFPSWPSRSTLSPTFGAQREMGYGYNNNNLDVPNAYISDFDLFPEDLEDDSTVPVLEEAPAPPRVAPAMPLLPLFAPERPRKKRSSSRKQSKLPKAMTPIAESPLAAPE